MNLFQRGAKAFNTLFTPLLRLPVIGPALSKGLVTVSYTGRRSGKRFTLPVAYQWQGGDVVIGVAMPEQKQWWRNFLGAGADLTLHLPDGDRTGRAVATRSDDGAVSLRVALG